MASLATSKSNRLWRLSQNSGDVLKYRPSRNAVSAVIERFPRTISFILLGGTLTSLASLFWLSSIGLRNSSKSISPGCTGFILTGMITLQIDFLTVRFAVLSKEGCRVLFPCGPAREL